MLKMVSFLSVFSLTFLSVFSVSFFISYILRFSLFICIFIVKTEELAFAGRNQGILWMIDSSSGKVLTSLQFVDNSSAKLS